MRALQTGSMRFGDLKHAIPNISDALLSERLKELETEGIVTRDVTPSTPVLIEYRLTERGRRSHEGDGRAGPMGRALGRGRNRGESLVDAVSAPDWMPAGRLEDLPDGKANRISVGDEAVLLVRAGERVYALGGRCTHQGAPLARGPVKISGSLATVTCPAHGSVFGLEDGRVMRGPATRPVEAFETRVVDGVVEVRSTG